MSRIGILATMSNIRSPNSKGIKFKPQDSQNSQHVNENDMNNLPSLPNSFEVKLKKKTKIGEVQLKTKKFINQMSHSYLSKIVKEESSFSRGSQIKFPNLNTPRYNSNAFVEGDPKITDFRIDPNTKLGSLKIVMEDLSSSYEPPSLVNTQKRLLEKFKGVKLPDSQRSKIKKNMQINEDDNNHSQNNDEVAQSKKSEWVNPVERMRAAVAIYKEEIIQKRKPLDELSSESDS